MNTPKFDNKIDTIIIQYKTYSVDIVTADGNKHRCTAAVANRYRSFIDNDPNWYLAQHKQHTYNQYSMMTNEVKESYVYHTYIILDIFTTGVGQQMDAYQFFYNSANDSIDAAEVQPGTVEDVLAVVEAFDQGQFEDEGITQAKNQAALNIAKERGIMIDNLIAYVNTDTVECSVEYDWHRGQYHVSDGYNDWWFDNLNKAMDFHQTNLDFFGI